jgi:hypothetical protein
MNTYQVSVNSAKQGVYINNIKANHYKVRAHTIRFYKNGDTEAFAVFSLFNPISVELIG